LTEGLGLFGRRSGPAARAERRASRTITVAMPASSSAPTTKSPTCAPVPIPPREEEPAGAVGSVEGKDGWGGGGGLKGLDP